MGCGPSQPGQDGQMTAKTPRPNPDHKQNGHVTSKNHNNKIAPDPNSNVQDIQSKNPGMQLCKKTLAQIKFTTKNRNEIF